MKETRLDFQMPGYARFQWPKAIPQLPPELQAVSDDWMHQWLEVLPKRYGMLVNFNQTYPLRFLPEHRPFRTLEIGAGIGTHLTYEDFSLQQYHCIELRENVAAKLRERFPSVTVTLGDCQEKVPYGDSYFDRVLALHVLEHLPDLPSAVAEVRRVLRPGGLFSIVIPCDPGLAYELARKVSAEPLFKRRYGLRYKAYIRHEHVNSPAEVLYVMQNGFEEIDRKYFPLPIPSVALNLCLGLTYRKR